MRRKNASERMENAALAGRYALIRPHGGAGASTLAALLDPGRSGAVIELAPGARLPAGREPVIVARSTARGIEAAASMRAGWSARLPRPALVVVADAPLPAPRVVQFKVSAISGNFRIVVDMPYLCVLRELVDPADALAIPRALSAVVRLREALEGMAAGEEVIAG